MYYAAKHLPLVRQVPGVAHFAAGDLANFATGGVTMLFSNEDTVLP
ncbi:hypothetical protein HYG77_23855 [Rhodococcus sp. ZPP]|nr:hypothetical protein [Rhodococcus sp. ZPP]QTJ68309.1 hypothetical protein HYG77_23855 [Rhodococcus sp. ZPP]